MDKGDVTEEDEDDEDGIPLFSKTCKQSVIGKL